MYNCDGIKPHIAENRIKMIDFDINKLKKDMTFIEEGITLSNVSKK
jgi:hypothetical protein